jgi:hypothetical protein
VVKYDVKHWPHRHKRVNKSERNPDDKGDILVPQRLAGFLPVTAPTQQRAYPKVDDVDEEREQVLQLPL